MRAQKIPVIIAVSADVSAARQQLATLSTEVTATSGALGRAPAQGAMPAYGPGAAAGGAPMSPEMILRQAQGIGTHVSAHQASVSALASRHEEDLRGLLARRYASDGVSSSMQAIMARAMDGDERFEGLVARRAAAAGTNVENVRLMHAHRLESVRQILKEGGSARDSLFSRTSRILEGRPDGSGSYSETAKRALGTIRQSAQTFDDISYEGQRTAAEQQKILDLMVRAKAVAEQELLVHQKITAELRKQVREEQALGAAQRDADTRRKAGAQMRDLNAIAQRESKTPAERARRQGDFATAADIAQVRLDEISSRASYYEWQAGEAAMEGDYRTARTYTQQAARLYDFHDRQQERIYQLGQQVLRADTRTGRAQVRAEAVGGDVEVRRGLGENMRELHRVTRIAPAIQESDRIAQRDAAAAARDEALRSTSALLGRARNYRDQADRAGAAGDYDRQRSDMQTAERLETMARNQEVRAHRSYDTYASQLDRKAGNQRSAQERLLDIQAKSAISKVIRDYRDGLAMPGGLPTSDVANLNTALGTAKLQLQDRARYYDESRDAALLRGDLEAASAAEAKMLQIVEYQGRNQHYFDNLAQRMPGRETEEILRKRRFAGAMRAIDLARSGAPLSGLSPQQLEEARQSMELFRDDARRMGHSRTLTPEEQKTARQFASDLGFDPEERDRAYYEFKQLQKRFQEEHRARQGPLGFLRPFGFGGPDGTNHISRGFGFAHRNISRAAAYGGLYGAGVVGLGAGVITRSLQEFATSETQKNALAGMVNTYGEFTDVQGNAVTAVQSFNKALEYSEDLYRRVRKEAADTILTTQELMELMIAGSPQLLRNGFSPQESLRVVSDIATIGKFMQLPSTAIVSDIRDLSTGRVTSRSQVLLAAGFETDEYRAALSKGPGATIDYINERLSGIRQALARQAEQPEAVMSRMKDSVEQLLIAGGSRVYSRYKDRFDSFTKEVNDGQGQGAEFIDNIAKAGEVLLDAAMAFAGFVGSLNMSNSFDVGAMAGSGALAFSAYGIAQSSVGSMFSTLTAGNGLGFKALGPALSNRGVTAELSESVSNLRTSFMGLGAAAASASAAMAIFAFNIIAANEAEQERIKKEIGAKRTVAKETLSAYDLGSASGRQRFLNAYSGFAESNFSQSLMTANARKISAAIAGSYQNPNGEVTLGDAPGIAFSALMGGYGSGTMMSAAGKVIPRIAAGAGPVGVAVGLGAVAFGGLSAYQAVSGSRKEEYRKILLSLDSAQKGDAMTPEQLGQLMGVVKEGTSPSEFAYFQSLIGAGGSKALTEGQRREITSEIDRVARSGILGYFKTRLSPQEMRDLQYASPQWMQQAMVADEQDQENYLLARQTRFATEEKRIAATLGTMPEFMVMQRRDLVQQQRDLALSQADISYRIAESKGFDSDAQQAVELAKLRQAQSEILIQAQQQADQMENANRLRIEENRLLSQKNALTEKEIQLQLGAMRSNALYKTGGISGTDFISTTINAFGQQAAQALQLAGGTAQYIQAGATFTGTRATSVPTFGGEEPGAFQLRPLSPLPGNPHGAVMAPTTSVPLAPEDRAEFNFDTDAAMQELEYANYYAQAGPAVPNTAAPNSIYKFKYSGKKPFVSEFGSQTYNGRTMHDLILQYAHQAGVSSPEDIAAIYGMIQAESAGRYRLVSSAGARGLLQLMPSTAKGLGVKDSFDPAQNLQGGIRYYAQMLRKFGGDRKLAVAAYNAGPGAVSRHGGIPPFRETRNHVAKIFGGAGGGFAGQAATALAGGLTGMSAVPAQDTEYLTALAEQSRLQEEYNARMQDGGWTEAQILDKRRKKEQEANIARIKTIQAMRRDPEAKQRAIDQLLRDNINLEGLKTDALRERFPNAISEYRANRKANTDSLRSRLNAAQAKVQKLAARAKAPASEVSALPDLSAAGSGTVLESYTVTDPRAGEQISSEYLSAAQQVFQMGGQMLQQTQALAGAEVSRQGARINAGFAGLAGFGGGDVAAGVGNYLSTSLAFTREQGMEKLRDQVDGEAQLALIEFQQQFMRIASEHERAVVAANGNEGLLAAADAQMEAAINEATMGLNMSIGTLYNGYIQSSSAAASRYGQQSFALDSAQRQSRNVASRRQLGYSQRLQRQQFASTNRLALADVSGAPGLASLQMQLRQEQLNQQLGQAGLDLDLQSYRESRAIGFRNQLLGIGGLMGAMGGRSLTSDQILAMQGQYDQATDAEIFRRQTEFQTGTDGRQAAIQDEINKLAFAFDQMISRVEAVNSQLEQMAQISLARFQQKIDDLLPGAALVTPTTALDRDIQRFRMMQQAELPVALQDMEQQLLAEERARAAAQYMGDEGQIAAHMLSYQSSAAFRAERSRRAAGLAQSQAESYYGYAMGQRVARRRAGEVERFSSAISGGLGAIAADPMTALFTGDGRLNTLQAFASPYFSNFGQMQQRNLQAAALAYAGRLPDDAAAQLGYMRGDDGRYGMSGTTRLFSQRQIAQRLLAQELQNTGSMFAGQFLGRAVGGDSGAVNFGSQAGLLLGPSLLGGMAAGPAGLVGALAGGLLGGLFGRRRNPEDEAEARWRDRVEELLASMDRSLRPVKDVAQTIRGEQLFGASSRYVSGRYRGGLSSDLAAGVV